MNVSDTERVATKLSQAGYEIVGSDNLAEIVLLNTCSVRERAERKLFTRVGELADKKRHAVKPIIGVLGCVAQLEGENLFDKTQNIDFVLGTRAVGRIGEMLDEINQTEEKRIDLGERELDYDWAVSDQYRNSKFVAFVPIIEGCNKFCTYCIVPFSRGRERSLSPEQILSQLRQLKEKGIKEVHLIGQNVNSYRPKTDLGFEGIKGATPFSKLLRAVAQTGIERIKFTTSFPRDFHPDIVEAINEYENLCNWVHLPVQSGSDRILRAMRRGHSSADYLKKIEVIERSQRRISLTTDIIVGFPSETDQDFRETVELYEKCRFDTAYLFKYSPRPGTPSAQIEDSVSDQTKRERFLILESVQKRIQEEKLKEFVGKTVQVLAENFSAKSENDLTGHTTCHKVVNFESDNCRLGQIVEVFITDAKTNSLRGKLWSEE
ncbi:MAG: tRNA (N6-isopentenyl adenosine(37)-C2)-methylthiotransferase MiaB [Acidobacteriota bacterium]|nr:tRNA (N6-isopentenyl adenosine(37)-C2)-methylthiotransferase MiaB [Acidobacteriota bacterium]